MPRKKIPRATFDHPPETMHCMVLKERPYWFLYSSFRKDKGNSRETIILCWITACTRCGSPFLDESGLFVFWLHKRCPRHRRMQPPINKQVADAIRLLKKLY
jgi:hypothetical protein